MILPNNDELLASAIGYLLEGQETYEASLLLLSNIETCTWNDYNDVTSLMIVIIGNRAIYDIIQNEERPSNKIIKNAFNAVLPLRFCVEGITARTEPVSIDTNWRKSMEEVLQGKGALNQCIPIEDGDIFHWSNLRFRSPSEVAIAKALNEYEVLFLPDCMARLGSPSPNERKNKEADFLICCDGKWGIIEVDGDKYHPSAAKDHLRDRLFKTHRIRVIEHYTGTECTTDPKRVVSEFLDLLRKNG
jgi:hypothetical protein